MTVTTDLSAIEEISVYQAIGGRTALAAAVDDFYGRLLADPVLGPFFPGGGQGGPSADRLVDADLLDGGHIGGHGHAWLLSRGGLPRRSASRACPRLSNGYSFPLFAPPANE